MNKLYNIVLVAILLSVTSCTKDFDEINSNPNAPIDVQPSLLLRQVLWNYGEEMSYEGFVAGNLLSQHFTMIDFNLFDRHSLTEPQFGGNPWPVIYRNLRDNEIILNKAREDELFGVYEGPALILKAYMAAALTDMYGDVPYSEALAGKDGNVTPVYDDQETIYLAENGILDNLEKAIISINNYTGNSLLEGDILYNGDLNQWIKFANSLRIKHLMRISDMVDVSNELQTIYDEGNYISSNMDNAAYDFNNNEPNNFRMANLRTGDFNLFIMSETIAEILNDFNDPRISVFFRPISNDGTTYQGLLNGPDASQLSISLADYSLTGTIFREETGNLDANFVTAWETNLFLAEAAQKGYINADAKALYELGVAQTFEYWQTPMPSDYLTSGTTAYDNGTDPLAQIATQKWLSNIVNGYEAWIEYRRTGFPALKTISGSLNNDLIPVRMPYPTDEDALNNANFRIAAQKVDGNSINTGVWWDN